MAETGPFSRELNLLGKSVTDIFSGRVLAWQLGGTLVAALCFSVATSIPVGRSGFARLMVSGLGLVVAYVVLMATNCLVARLLSAAAKGEEDGGVAPLHFLIDNIGSALLLPLVLSAGAVALALVFYLLSLPAGANAWQTILILLWPAILAAALATVAALYVALFITPAMIVNEQPPFMDGLRRLMRMVCARRIELSKLFGLGLAASLVVIAPVQLLLMVSMGASAYVHLLAADGMPGDFGQFLLRVYLVVLVGLVWTVALAFLNAVAFNAYEGLADGLDDEEASEEETGEDGAAPSQGESVDLEVQEKGGADASPKT